MGVLKYSLSILNIFSITSIMKFFIQFWTQNCYDIHSFLSNLWTGVLPQKDTGFHSNLKYFVSILKFKLCKLCVNVFLESCIDLTTVVARNPFVLHDVSRGGPHLPNNFFMSSSTLEWTSRGTGSHHIQDINRLQSRRRNGRFPGLEEKQKSNSNELTSKSTVFFRVLMSSLCMDPIIQWMCHLKIAAIPIFFFTPLVFLQPPSLPSGVILVGLSLEYSSLGVEWGRVSVTDLGIMPQGTKVTLVGEWNQSLISTIRQDFHPSFMSVIV